MDVIFIHHKLEKEFNDARSLQRNRGKVQAEKIKARMAQIHAAIFLDQLRPPMPGRFHPLGADKAGWIACDLDGPYRLVFEPANDPLPYLDAGGLDWKKITQVRVLGVLNYHERNKQKPV